MRNYSIDNLRIICILLLFPFHTCMIYNTWGELFYITSTPNVLAGGFVSAVYPWWMTLLFVIAGISSYYALQHRTIQQYILERVKKLLIPLIVGLVVIIPVQSYIADIFYTGYTGNYFEHYKIFFTRFTYLTGQDGGFTPGHLWFILYLFVDSLILAPIMNWYVKSKKNISEKVTIGKLLPLFLVILLSALILDIGGKSLGEFTACFLIGFFLLTSEQIQNKLSKNWIGLIILFVAVVIARLAMPSIGLGSGLIWDIESRMVTWFGILAMLALGRRFLNHSNLCTKYLSKAAFPLYYFHQSILVIVGFFILKYVEVIWMQFLLIMCISFVLSLLCYEICRRFQVTSFLFGIKYRKKLNK